MLSSCRFRVTLSREISTADHSSLVASCHIEGELDSDSIDNHAERVPRPIREAYALAGKAIDDELSRQQKRLRNSSDDNPHNVRGNEICSLGSPRFTCDHVDDWPPGHICPMVRDRLAHYLDDDTMDSI
jgi:hypothetical protein